MTQLLFCKRVLRDPLIEIAWMYRQLGMTQSQIAEKLNVRQTHVSKFLKERREAVENIDRLEGDMARRYSGWEPWWCAAWKRAPQGFA